MEEFEKIDWTPNIEDIIDNQFINEERMMNESAMYKIMNGTFQDPFQDIRPRIFTSKLDIAEQTKQGANSNEKKDVKKPKGRGRKKKKQK